MVRVSYQTSVSPRFALMRPPHALLKIVIYTDPGSTGGKFWSKLLIWRSIEVVERGYLDLGC